jgi:hypothetical protein
VKERSPSGTPEKITKIKKLPTIISLREMGPTGAGGICFYPGLKVQDNGIKVYYQKFFPIPFSFLSEHLTDLANVPF